jgi:hypothetical protein
VLLLGGHHGDQQPHRDEFLRLLHDDCHGVGPISHVPQNDVLHDDLHVSLPHVHFHAFQNDHAYHGGGLHALKLSK